MSKRAIHGLVFSWQAMQTAQRLQSASALKPLNSFQNWHIPQNLWLRANQPSEFQPFQDLKELLAQIWRISSGLIFCCATGIAVRAIAPFIQHKAQDPAVVVIDASAKFVIALLSGHLGGANALAEALAKTLQATPVITTASEQICHGFALDLWLRNNGAKILDWRELPQIQAALLEKRPVRLHDPHKFLPKAEGITRVNATQIKSCSKWRIGCHWKKQPPADKFLRVAMPVLFTGIGFRKNVTLAQILKALQEIWDKYNLEPAAMAALATVNEKHAVLQPAKEILNIQIVSYSASILAQISTPHPAEICGRRFGVKPFSVCEAAALQAAGKSSRLLVPKIAVNECMTFAIAIAPTYKNKEDQPCLPRCTL